MSSNPRRRQRVDSSQEEPSPARSSVEIMTEISDKMSIIIEKLENLITIARDNTQTQTEIFQKEFKETREVIGNGFLTLVNQTKSRNDVFLQSEKYNLKTRLSSWKNQLNDRKKAFWLFLKNEKLSEKYQEWLTSTPTRILRKFLHKPIPGETEEQTEIRNRFEKETMWSEMEIMNIRISNLKNKYKAIDQAMNSEIDKRFTDDSVKIMLKDQWKKDCMNEENISEDIWKQKEEWLLEQELEAEEIEMPIKTTFIA